MSYLEFLAEWYNWPYLVALAGTAASFLIPSALEPVGAWLGRRLGLAADRGVSNLRTFAVTFAVAGLTVNGALHDYWPRAQEAGFLPGLAISAAIAALLTRKVAGVRDRHFPEIKAVGFGSSELTGREGRVVSRTVGPDYRPGRAQVMEEDGTLHMALCKTREEEIPYGARVVLGEYDESDGRYYVERAGDAESDPATTERAGDAPGDDEG